jgi:hypothetical protein
MNKPFQLQDSKSTLVELEGVLAIRVTGKFTNNASVLDCLEFTRSRDSSLENYYYSTYKDCIKEQERILTHLNFIQL